MPFFVLLLIAFACPFILFIMAAERIEKLKIMLVGLLFAFCVTWMVGACSVSSKFKEEYVVPVINVKNADGSIGQHIIYEGKSVNLNCKFKSAIEPGATIRVKVPSSGPYCGVYCWPLEDKYEIVK